MLMFSCAGRRDVIGDDGVDEIKKGLSGGDSCVEVKRFEKSGHLPHLDEREEYVEVREAARRGGALHDATEVRVGI